MATVKVWDIAVRVFHWSLVAAFATAYLSGDENELLHVNAGYAIISLLAFRVLWGFIGSKHARFSDFMYSPAKIFAYARSFASGSPHHYLGHNPLGGIMVIALLASLALACFSGLKLYAAEDGKGPLAGVDSINLISNAYAHEGGEHNVRDKAGTELWEEIHEFFVDVSLGLIVLHIAGVVVSSVLHREKLVKAMITGEKEN